MFILEPTSLTKDNERFQLSSKFQFDQSVDPRTAWEVGPGPTQTYYGLNFYGLRYPPGTAQDFVIPEFQLPSIASSILDYSLTTDGLKVNFDCEILPLTNGSSVDDRWESESSKTIVANVTTKDCNITGAILALGPSDHTYHIPNATQNYQSRFDVYPCNVDFNFGGDLLDPDNATQNYQIFNVSRDLRIFMSVADLRISAYNASEISPRYMYLHNLTAALCKPSYELGQFDVGVPDAANGSARGVFSAAAAAQPGLKQFPNGSLAMAVESTTTNWYLGNGGVDYVISAAVPTFFQLMLKKTGLQSVGSFLEPDLLVSTGSDVFKGIATQVLHQLAVQPANRTTSGSITYTEQRLRVKVISTGFMCGFLGLLFILSVAMIFVRPSFSAPDQPGSVLSMATVLASSPDFNEILLPMGSLSNEELERRLAEYQFLTIHSSDAGANASVSIEPIRQNEAQTTNNHVTEQDMSQVPSWRPAASTTWFLVLAICLPLAVIAALEIIQHFSDVNDGFVSITQSNSLALATYIPSAVSLGVASIYAAMQMMAATFAPFTPLKRGNASAGRTVMLNLVGQLPPRALFLSLKTKNFAVAIVLLGSFLGSFLSIIVSGLYSVISVPIVQNTTLQQSDTFNFGTTNVDLSVVDNEATPIDNLVEYLGVNSPKWTSGDLAFNTLSQDAISTTNSSANATLTVQVPAVRASLNCTSIPNGLRKVTSVDTQGTGGNEQPVMPGRPVDPNTIFSGYNMITVNTPLRYADWCESAPKGMKNETTWSQDFLITDNTTTAYVGIGAFLAWGFHESNEIVGDGALPTVAVTGTTPEGIQVTDNGCPTFAVTFGQIKVNRSGKESTPKTSDVEMDLATIVCYQNIEQVMTNATWQLPDFSFDPSQLPTTDESTAKLLKSNRGSERFSYLLNAWLVGLNNPLSNQTIPGPNNSDPSNNNLDAFSEALVLGKGGRAAQELAGSKNVDNLKNAAQRLYGEYMAQAISLNMRDNKTASNEAPLPTYNGAVTTSGHQRLQQNRAPKIALEVVLGVMAACGLATRLLLPVRDVLPHNPCSIAGTATLIAGGQVVSRLSAASKFERTDGKHADIVSVLANGLYSMKWWQDAGGAQRYGIDLEPS